MSEGDEIDNNIIGGILQASYEGLKHVFKTPESESFFDFIDNTREQLRPILEEDRDFKRIYRGGDIIKKS